MKESILQLIAELGLILGYLGQIDVYLASMGLRVLPLKRIHHFQTQVNLGVQKATRLDVNVLFQEALQLCLRAFHV
jgi:hypothetical protein